jgi:cell division protein FtsL
MSAGKFHSRRKSYFQLLLLVFGLLLIAFGYLKVDTFLMNQNITDKRVMVEEQTKQLDAYKLLTGYNKLQAVKILEEQQTSMPRSSHITKIIDMLEDMKNIDTNTTDSIQLSDFNVSMDKITLKGQVSSLLLLYYSNTNKGIKSLIDRFSSLDFVKDISIHTYDRVQESNYYEFVLEANVINDAGTGSTTK